MGSKGQLVCNREISKLGHLDEWMPKWLKTWLDGWAEKVMVNRSYSTLRLVPSRVMQGSSLGPIPFNIFFQ
ncbi:hypothetical protein QYF61_020301 [Mycteria americana]|uniref:Reverse transcriptase domain-containing protein n=1 Tax=Mycteria americana TaxID=33587 RepID=A0AAN7NX44_MYCAM|nr:hypothetical protein QYF61_020301 [Mycteria americana]